MEQLFSIPLTLFDEYNTRVEREKSVKKAWMDITSVYGTVFYRVKSLIGLSKTKQGKMSISKHEYYKKNKQTLARDCAGHC